MKTLIRLALAPLAVVALIGCGGSPLAPGKESAASAMFEASRGAGSYDAASSSILRILEQGIASVEVGLDCPKGGRVFIGQTLELIGTTTGEFSFDLRYDHCNYNGRTSLNGTLATSMSFSVTDSTAAIDLHFQGRVDFSGEVSDFVDVDVTQTVSAVALDDTQAATVSVLLNGTVTNSTGTYTFENETLVVTTGFQTLQSGS